MLINQLELNQNIFLSTQTISFRLTIPWIHRSPPKKCASIDPSPPTVQRSVARSLGPAGNFPFPVVLQWQYLQEPPKRSGHFPMDRSKKYGTFVPITQ